MDEYSNLIWTLVALAIWGFTWLAEWLKNRARLRDERGAVAKSLMLAEDITVDNRQTSSGGNMP